MRNEVQVHRGPLYYMQLSSGTAFGWPNKLYLQFVHQRVGGGGMSFSNGSGSVDDGSGFGSK